MIQIIESFYIRPKPSINVRSKHLNPKDKYKAIGYEEFQTNVRTRNEKGQFQTHSFTDLVFYVANDLGDLTQIDNRECKIELFDHNKHKTILR